MTNLDRYLMVREGRRADSNGPADFGLTSGVRAAREGSRILISLTSLKISLGAAARARAEKPASGKGRTSV